MFKNSHEVRFARSLGQYVELGLAPGLLSEVYERLEYLGPFFPWADYFGYRDDEPWLISVKGRFMYDQWETARAGKLTRNPNYKLDGALDQALRIRSGKLAWLTVALDFSGACEAYHGTVEHLRTLGLKGSGVPMSASAIERNRYDCLKIDRHSFPFDQHPNTWAYALMQIGSSTRRSRSENRPKKRGSRPYWFDGKPQRLGALLNEFFKLHLRRVQ